jgi:tRNA threonylcarbamoyladenosine modification (KEOPS) complex Cgi121 subunit
MMAKEIQDNIDFINECIETRKEVSTIQASSFHIINDYLKLEDFAIMYDQLLERTAAQYGIDIYEKQECPF